MKRLRSLLLAAVALAATAAQAQQLQIAFTVDDLPSHGDLPPGVTRQQVAQSFLDTFKREHLPPVYGFVNGVRKEQGPSALPVLQLWHNAGEPLGNHTWAHTSINDQTPEQFQADVDKNDAFLKQVDPTGDIKWLRFPFLDEGDTVEKRRAVRAGLQQRGYRIAEVSMDFEDYAWNNPYARCAAKNDTVAVQWLHDSYLQVADQYIDTFRHLSQDLFHRDVPYVLLMHIGAFDAKMLPELIALYRKRGFTFVSMTQALADPGYAEDPDLGDKFGGSQLELLAEARHLKIKAPAKPYKRLDELCR